MRNRGDDRSMSSAGRHSTEIAAKVTGIGSAGKSGGVQAETEIVSIQRLAGLKDSRHIGLGWKETHTKIVGTTMRLYHFLSAQHAIENLKKGRIKLSEIGGLNDPFELWSSAQKSREVRAKLRQWKADMSERYLLLCFCGHWASPLLWSHYADRHRGVCLGFDVPDESVQSVRYVRKRTPLSVPVRDKDIARLLNTKYSGWKYEEEWRSWFRREDRDESSGLYFHQFSDRIQLREVIAGPLCEVPRSSFDQALERYESRVKLVKARLAFGSFRVVANRQGFRD
jgi:hypothetical protein